MIIPSVLVITTIMMLPLQAVQQSPDYKFQKSDVNEIEKAFSSYNQALVEKKYQELPRYVQVPFVIADGMPRIVTEIGVVVAGLRRNRESLDERGYAKSIPGKAHISVLASDRVLVNRIINHYKKDGSLLESRANFYLMTKASEGWKITGIVQQEVAYAGKMY